ncbi:hypothetical protein [Altererythrobacter sp. GH1-8]|uniref:hypothetical protein n=1 Tax=Altererythrobacter sp. GH1-8 TaxID=3349333 RepID=UPI00374D3A35
MTKLTKLIAPALAATMALSVAVPAQAAHGWVGPSEIRAEMNQLDREIDRALHRGQLSRGEAHRFERQLGFIQYKFRSHARAGFSRGELQHLDKLVDQLRFDLRQEIRFAGRHDRRDRYAYNDRYDRHERYDRQARYDRDERDWRRDDD